jgi:hypothetical protein
VESDEIGGPDTSDRTLDVDSIDQADDSQEMAEETIYPKGMSHAAREDEDFRAEERTGFRAGPNAPDDPYDTETPLEDQNVNALEAISGPGQATVVGSGGLATAALELFASKGSEGVTAISRFMVESGVPRPDAEGYGDAVARGLAVIAVEIVPGRVDEEQVEAVIEEHGGRDGALFDGRRFNEFEARRNASLG